MDEDDRHEWLLAATSALSEKIKHDSEYLQRRAARGTSTPTDTMMSRDMQGLQAILETLEAEMDRLTMPPAGKPKDITYTELLSYDKLP